MMQLIQKVKRQLLFHRDRLSPFQDLSEQVYQQSIQYHHKYLPQISDEDKMMINQIQKNGIFITSLEKLGILSTPQMLIDLKKIIPHLIKDVPISKKQYIIKASSELLLKYPTFLHWGTEKKLLNLVEYYLGLPVAYHGVYLRRDLANNIQRKTRLWHLDIEDRKMLKIIIYLHEVCEEAGPLQYIPKGLTPWIFHKLKYSYGKISDQEMQAIISSTDWKSCLGKAGTVILIDPASVFHRGKVPVKSDRFSIFFDYTSRMPKYPYFCKSCCGINELIQLSQPLSKEAKNCIFWNFNLKQKYYQNNHLY